MKAELIIAPPAAGKTTMCIQRIQANQKEHPIGQVWVLVQDRQKAKYFRARLAAEGGGMGVTIGTFRDFYRDILERNGNFVPVISPALGHRLIQEIVREAHASGNLPHFSAIIEKPGFLIALQDSFAELRGAAVQPESFLDYTHNSTPARYELAFLYDRFLSRLRTLNWIDMEGQSWLAIEALEKDPKTAAHLQLVVADGFTLFTNAQRRFFKPLEQQVGELLITLPGKIGSKRPVHQRSMKVIETLQTDLSIEAHEIPTSPRLSAAVLHMEQFALDPQMAEKQEPQKPVMLEAQTQSEESREALRWIKELHVREHIPLSACAIFTSNLEIYQPLLRMAANEFGINVHFSHPDSLAESPAVLAMSALINLPLDDFPTRIIINTLRSPYFDFGLSENDLENLELVSQQAIIVKGRKQWDDAWKMLESSKSSGIEQQDDERQRMDLTAGIDLPALRISLDKFWDLYLRTDVDRSQSDWVAWLENLLTKLDFYNQISSERDRAACASLGDALRALVISESVVGIRKVDFAHFLIDLQGALKGARVEEPRESSDNAVLVGKIVEARGFRFRAVVLLGLSEGLFPVIENPDPFLDEELRKDLGLEPRLQREQASTFYQAFTRADTHLLLTRPYLSDDGEPWEASPYWLSIKNLFTKEAVIKIQPGRIRAQADAASSQELLFWGVQQQQMQYREDNELNKRWQALEKAHAMLDSRRARNAKGIFEGNLEKISPSLAGRYSAAYDWSPSRLEEYGNCPYRFFINSTLKLAPKTTPEPGLDADQIGSIYHQILELVYKQAINDLVSPLDILDEVAKEVFKNAPNKFKFRISPLWDVEKAQFLEKLRLTLQALEDERGEWVPLGFETKFGIEGTAVLELTNEDELIRLHGVIDRVDKNSKDEIRVIDYKSGSSHMGKADLESGLRLQLPVYGMAAQQALHLGNVVEGFYWKINEAKASSLKLSSFETDDGEGPQAAYQMATNQIFKHVSNIRSGKFPPKAPKEGCPDYCPAIQWCWRYQAGYKND